MCRGILKCRTKPKKLLNLGKKFRLHPKLDIVTTKTEIEKGLAIIRWKEKETDETEAETNFNETEGLSNVEKKVVDISMMKATELKFNRRLYALNAAPDKLESNLQQTREALEKVFEDDKSENADKNGNIRKSNITQRQEKGVRDLKEKTKDDGDR